MKPKAVLLLKRLDIQLYDKKYKYFQNFLHAVRENLTNVQIIQNVEHDIQKILAWFIIDYFGHNIDLIEQARKKIRPQSTADETVLAEKSDYVWDPEWSYELFIYIPTDISSQAISSIFFNNNYIDYTHLQLTQHV